MGFQAPLTRKVVTGGQKLNAMARTVTKAVSGVVRIAFSCDGTCSEQQERNSALATSAMVRNRDRRVMWASAVGR